MKDHIAIIDERRTEIGMTIRALARKANLNDGLLSRTLNRKRKMTASEVIALSRVLGLSLDDYNSDNKTA